MTKLELFTLKTLGFETVLFGIIGLSLITKSKQFSMDNVRKKESTK